MAMSGAATTQSGRTLVVPGGAAGRRLGRSGRGSPSAGGSAANSVRLIFPGRVACRAYRAAVEAHAGDVHAAGAYRDLGFLQRQRGDFDVVVFLAGRTHAEVGDPDLVDVEAETALFTRRVEILAVEIQRALGEFERQPSRR